MATILVNDTDWTEISSNSCRMFQQARGVTYILYSATKPDIAVTKGEAVQGEESVALDEPIYGQSIWARTREGDGDQTLYIFDLPKRFDPIGGVHTTTEVQNSIHHKEAFYCSGKAIDIPVDGTLTLYCATGDRQVHFDSFSVDNTVGGFSIAIHTGITVSAPGNLRTPANRFVEATPVATTVQVYDTPTVTDWGTALPEIYKPISGSNPAKASAVGSGLESGFVFGANGHHSLTIRNDSGLVMSLGWVMTWHEPTVLL